MERKELESKGLTPEQIEFVLAENGKDVQKEQEKSKDAVAKATKPLNEKVAEMEKQAKEYEEKLKGVEGMDAKSKEEITKLQKEHADKLKEMQKAHESETAKMKRETETKEFFTGLGKKFVTPETAKAFEEKLNAALDDKAYEGKNRKEILEMLTKGEDGKERTDIYAPADSNTTKPNATGGTNPPPNGGGGEGTPKAVPKII